jgi:hypothetical protein
MLKANGVVEYVDARQNVIKYDKTEEEDVSKF